MSNLTVKLAVRNKFPEYNAIFCRYMHTYYWRCFSRINNTCNLYFTVSFQTHNFTVLYCISSFFLTFKNLKPTFKRLDISFINIAYILCHFANTHITWITRSLASIKIPLDTSVDYAVAYCRRQLHRATQLCTDCISNRCTQFQQTPVNILTSKQGIFCLNCCLAANISLI